MGVCIFYFLFLVSGPFLGARVWLHWVDIFASAVSGPFLVLLVAAGLLLTD